MRRAASFLLLAALAAAPAARAWDGHDLIRRKTLEDLPELLARPAVEVTHLDAEVEGINPATTFGYVGASPGETQHPLDILATYAQEPDWGMDQELNVSWQQRFMGGYTGLSSQGYFHMYYPAVTLHLPIPVMSMGAAPKRAQQWADMSRAAFERGNEYWGWRFAAWALHYVEDLAQPYHSTQTHRKFIRLRSPIQGTTNCTSNFHLTYEHWLSRRLMDEAAGGLDLGLVQALKVPGDLAGDDVEDVVRRVAKRSHKGFGKLAGDCIRYFGDKFRSDEKVEATEEDLDRVEPGEVFDRIMVVSRKYLELAGQANRAWVRALLQELGPAAPTSD